MKHRSASAVTSPDSAVPSSSSVDGLVVDRGPGAGQVVVQMEDHVTCRVGHRGRGVGGPHHERLVVDDGAGLDRGDDRVVGVVDVGPDGVVGPELGGVVAVAGRPSPVARVQRHPADDDRGRRRGWSWCRAVDEVMVTVHEPVVPMVGRCHRPDEGGVGAAGVGQAEGDDGPGRGVDVARAEPGVDVDVAGQGVVCADRVGGGLGLIWMLASTKTLTAGPLLPPVPSVVTVNGVGVPSVRSSWRCRSPGPGWAR